MNDQATPLFFVTGYKGSGKDTVVGEALARVFRTRALSCSTGIRPSLANVWAMMIEQNRINEECFASGRIADMSTPKKPTEWLEARLLEFINGLPKDPEPGSKPHECSRIYQIAHGDYCAWDNATHWIEEAVKSGAGVVTGVRRQDELVKARSVMKRRIVNVWCDRIGYKPTGADNLDLTARDADIIIRVAEFPRVVCARIAATDCIYINKAFFQNPVGRKVFEIKPQPEQQ